MEHAMHELKLNVSNFYRDGEVRQLLDCEESATFPASDDDYYVHGEKFYECIFGSRICRVSRSSILALSLFCTLAVAVVLISVVLLCTVLTMTSSTKEPEPADEVVGVINWLHYPVGELVLRGNRTLT